MKTKTLLFVLLTGLIITSCQKEISFEQPTDVPGGNGNGNGGGNNNGGNNGNNGGNNNTSIIGEWDFINVTGHSVATVVVDQSGMNLKSVTTSDYVSKDNTGTMKFTDTEFSYTDVGYIIDTIVSVKMYLDDVLMSQSTQDFDMVSPPMSFTTTYTQNNTDSITLDNGTLAPTDPSGTPTPSGPLGLKISWSGDTLLLKTTSSYSRTITNAGSTGTLTGYLDGVIKLKRK